MIISDKDKNLVFSVHKILPLIKYNYCSKHIAKNMRLEFNKNMKKLFWKTTYAKTKLAWEIAIKKTKKVNVTCFEYITNIFIKQ